MYFRSSPDRCPPEPTPPDAKVSMPGFVLGQRDQALDRGGRNARMDDEDQRNVADADDRREVPDRIEGNAFGDQRIDDVSAPDHQQRRAIGRALATISAPIAPFAPARFSTTTVVPRLCCRVRPMPRPNASTAPPGEVGTITRTDLSGKFLGAGGGGGSEQASDDTHGSQETASGIFHSQLPEVRCDDRLFILRSRNQSITSGQRELGSDVSPVELFGWSEEEFRERL